MMGGRSCWAPNVKQQALHPMDEPEKELRRLKKELKRWEREITKTKGNKPSTEDIETNKMGKIWFKKNKEYFDILFKAEKYIRYNILKKQIVDVKKETPKSATQTLNSPLMARLLSVVEAKENADPNIIRLGSLKRKRLEAADEGTKDRDVPVKKKKRILFAQDTKQEMKAKSKVKKVHLPSHSFFFPFYIFGVNDVFWQTNETTKTVSVKVHTTRVPLAITMPVTRTSTTTDSYNSFSMYTPFSGLRESSLLRSKFINFKRYVYLFFTIIRNGKIRTKKKGNTTKQKDLIASDVSPPPHLKGIHPKIIWMSCWNKEIRLLKNRWPIYGQCILQVRQVI